MKDFIENILLNIYFISSPKWWIMNHPFNKELDELLISKINNYEITDLNGYTCKIGGIEVWIKNYPYAYGRIYNGLNGDLTHNQIVSSIRPSRSTIFKLKRKVDKYKEKRKANKKRIKIDAF